MKEASTSNSAVQVVALLFWAKAMFVSTLLWMVSLGSAVVGFALNWTTLPSLNIALLVLAVLFGWLAQRYDRAMRRMRHPLHL